MKSIAIGILRNRYNQEKLPPYKKAQVSKGECYHNCFYFMFENTDLNWKVVHGAVKGQGRIKNVIHGHAWVEVDYNGITWVYDPTCDVLVMKHYYYDEGNISYTVKYCKEQYTNMVVESEHSGPWDSKILDIDKAAVLELL